MRAVMTTLGPKQSGELGIILPHEHIFVDLRTCDKPGYAQARPEDVITLMKPELEKARAASVTALVECSPVGVGRRIDLLKAVSNSAQFPLIVPTGVYREPWIPYWIHEASEEDLQRWMETELDQQIDDSGVKAGFIKLSAGDDGITLTETKVLRAAAKAAAPCQAVIGSHTIRGRVVRDQLAIIDQAGYRPDRFIWIHAQAEPDFALNLEMAERGAWIEYDAIGSPDSDAFYLERIQKMLEAGFASQILLSHDRGWYDPAKPGGGTPQPFTYLTETFLPQLKKAGIDEPTVRLLTEENPFKAFAREV